MLSDDGSLQAELITIPRYFARTSSRDPLADLAADLGVERSEPVTATGLASLLEQIATETIGPRKPGRAAAWRVGQLAAVVANEPVVVVEQSPAIGRSLAALIGQGGPAYLLFAEGKPFLALAVDGALVIVWFIAGPVQGIREGLREGAHDATKIVATEAIEKQLRERFLARGPDA